MVNEKKKHHKVEAPEQAVQLEAVAVVVKGDRGVVGEPTAALTIKNLWHSEHHALVDYGNKHQQRWVKRPGAPSLKAYARKLVSAKHEIAMAWFEHKAGSLNESRSEKNVQRIALESQATSSAKKKKAQSKPAKTAAPAVAGNGMAK